jgi:transcription initiation factor TFIIB
MDKRDKVVEREYSKCSECSSNIVTGNGETYCANCGLVITENIVDLGPEWRSYDSEQAAKRIRVGPPITYQIYDGGLNLPHSFPTRTNVGAKSTNEISLTFALSEIGRMASALRLPENIREAASLLYRKAVYKKLLKGRSIEAITSAILYIICRQYGVPRTFEEIEKVSWVEEEYIYSAVKSLLRKLELKIPPASSCDFVPRFCSLLELSAETEIKALKITKETSKLNNNGQLPIGVTAGAIYIAAALNDEYRAKKEIAEITGVSIPTIFNRSKEISKQLNIDMPETKNRKRRTKNSFSFFV